MNTQLFAEILQILATHSKDLYGGELVYIEKQGFYIKNNGLYHSLDGLTTLSPEMTENKVFELSNSASVKTLLRTVVAPSALGSRSVFAQSPDGIRFVIGDSELSQEDFSRIEDKYEIYDLSPKYQNPYLQQLLREIRILTIEALARAERQRKRRSEIIKVWQKAQEYAEQNDFIKLEETRDRLLSLSGRQLSGVKNTIKRQVSEEFKEEYKTFIRKIKIYITVIITLFFSITLAGVSIRFKHIQSYVNQISIKTAPQQNTTGKIKKLTEQDIIKAVSEYNQSVSKTNQITTWRKQKIINCLSGKNINKQALRDSIEKFANPSYRFWLNCKN